MAIGLPLRKYVEDEFENVDFDRVEEILKQLEKEDKNK